ncbi:MAG: rhodanese-like domain-containing protein [Candidatus Thorarchaeota archaeon]
MKTKVFMTKNWCLVFIFFLIFLLLSAKCYSITGMLSEVNYVTISVTEARDLVVNDEELFILDVRNPDEFINGHIPGAYLIPVNDISVRESELPKNKSRPILVYCKSGGRSAAASTTLDSLGYTQVNNMNGGFDAWRDAGYLYEKGPFIKPTTIVTSSANTTQLSSAQSTSNSSNHSNTTPASELAFGIFGILLFIIKKKKEGKVN